MSLLFVTDQLQFRNLCICNGLKGAYEDKLWFKKNYDLFFKFKSSCIGLYL